MLCSVASRRYVCEQLDEVWESMSKVNQKRRLHAVSNALQEVSAALYRADLPRELMGAWPRAKWTRVCVRVHCGVTRERDSVFDCSRVRAYTGHASCSGGHTR